MYTVRGFWFKLDVAFLIIGKKKKLYFRILLFWDVMQCRLVAVLMFWDCLSVLSSRVKLGPVGCPNSSPTTWQPTLCHIPEGQRLWLHCVGNPKSCVNVAVWWCKWILLLTPFLMTYTVGCSTRLSFVKVYLSLFSVLTGAGTDCFCGTVDGILFWWNI